MDTEKFDRQILLFGEQGQRKLQATTVAIVGLGGLGSHVAQQLAYLGVNSFTLIDRDTVDRSNLNRLVGANEGVVGLHKVEVAESLIRSINPDANTVACANSFISGPGYELLKGVDFVFGCMDRDGARLVLTEFCSAYTIPYLDVATDVISDPHLHYGGRVVFSYDGFQCLYCKDMLDEQAVSYDLMPESQRQENDRIYGVPRSALRERGPAVVSLNGILASVAVTEFMAHVTGIRPAIRSLEYKGMSGKLVVDTDPPKHDCYYCRSVRGKRDAADLDRYVREGLGEHI